MEERSPKKYNKIGVSHWVSAYPDTQCSIAGHLHEFTRGNSRDLLELTVKRHAIGESGVQGNVMEIGFCTQLEDLTSGFIDPKTIYESKETGITMRIDRLGNVFLVGGEFHAQVVQTEVGVEV